MERNVFLICAGRGFMINAIVQELEAQEYHVQLVDPNPTRLSREVGAEGIWLLYCDEKSDLRETLVYLRDLLSDHEIPLCVIGKDEELEEVWQVIPKTGFAGSFQRPVNVKELGEKLDSIVSAQEAKAARKKILVVDDDGTMLRAMKNLLSEQYQVYMVNSGVAAITFLAKNQVDLVLLDYEMPVTSGPQVLEMMRSDSALSSIPVMFLTVKDDKESVMRVLALKPEKYLLKTLPPRELLANIAEFFEQR